jgi:hypothetical protein
MRDVTSYLHISMIFLLVLSIVVYLQPNSNLLRFLPVKVANKSFKPQYAFVKAFAKEPIHNNVPRLVTDGHVVLANVTFECIRPLTFLDNVEIEDVKCQEIEQFGDADFPTLIGPDLFVTFNTEYSAKLALEEWSKIKDLAMYVGIYVIYF